MALQKRGGYWYGSDTKDLKAEIIRYSELNGHIAARFATSKCPCGDQYFRLETDELAGAAKRTCAIRADAVFMGDSHKYAGEANFETHMCVCDNQKFGILSAVAIYPGSNDVRWYYIGCMCTKCNLVGVFADWKCESGDAGQFLSNT